MALHVGLLQVEFLLQGSDSLRDKRRAFSGLRDRLGRMPNVAVCESDHGDRPDAAQWSFVATGSSRQAVVTALDEIEQYLSTKVDAIIGSVEREFL